MKTVTQISPRFNMLPEEWKSYWEGFLWYFVLPLLTTYLTETNVRLSVYSFSWNLFIPDEFLIKSMFGLLTAQLISLAKKYVPANVVTSVVPDTKPVEVDPEPTVIDTTLLK